MDKGQRIFYYDAYVLKVALWEFTKPQKSIARRIIDISNH